MSNFLSRFYIFSKLSTSLILLIILIFLGYLFIKAYLEENFESNNLEVEKFDSRILKLSSLIEKNSTNLDTIKDLVIGNQQSVKDIGEKMSKTSEGELNKQSIIHLKHLSDENKALQLKLNALSLKIDNINLANKFGIKEQESSSYIALNFINLIKLKLDNGTDYLEEVKLLQDLPLDFDQLSYVAKLSILANKKFLGLTNLHNEFDQSSSEYLNNYYLNKNKNNFLKYFIYLVTIQPNTKKSIKDKNIYLLSLAKQRLLENDIEEVINQLTLLNNSDIFFDSWINKAEHYIAVNDILNRLIN